MSKYALTVTCQSRRGIVAAIANYLADHGCNITDSAQFDDKETGSFFMRISFETDTDVALEVLSKEFVEPATTFNMDYEFHDEAVKMKVVIMVSRFGHCLNDLLYRWRIGALPIDIVRSHLQPYGLPEGRREPRPPLPLHQGHQSQQAGGRSRASCRVVARSPARN